MSEWFAFTVPGKPIPQGSMRAFTRSGGRVGMTPGNEKELKIFRGLVANVALAAGARATYAPVEVEIDFVLARPKGHFGTGRNAEILKPSAPEFITTKPDIDKLLRAVLDALTGVCFGDDAQVVTVTVRKDYVQSFDDKPRTTVRLRKLREAAA